MLSRVKLLQVTTDPASRTNPVREGAGPVTSDSLAAESTRAGGGFAENRDAGPLDVKGANSTLNTTDTSAATKLDPVSQGVDRRDDGDVPLGSEGRDRGKGTTTGAPESRSGPSGDRLGSDGQQRQDAKGVDSKSGSVSASGSGLGSNSMDRSSDEQGNGTRPPGRQGQDQEGQRSTGLQPSSGQGQGQDLRGPDQGHETRNQGRDDRDHQKTPQQPGVAPTYVKADVLDQPQYPKPKGKNLKEGEDMDPEAPNASFTSEIGSADDPGRLAEQKMQLSTNEPAGDKGPRQKKVTGDDSYGALNAEEEA